MARKGKKLPEQPKKATKSPAQIVADKVRYHRDLDSRFVVIEETRVEYFRSKDLAELLSAHPELARPIVAQYEEDEVKDIPLVDLVGEELLAAKLIIRCDRVQKTIRPGKKKMSHWPGRLTFHRDQLFTTDDGFYAWLSERQSPVWQTLLSFLLPVVTVGCCLFPIFPNWAKLAVLYLLLPLIAAIFLILILRWVVFVVVWVATGRRVWFFPSILAEEGTLAELFRFWPDKDELPPAKVTTRLAAGAMLALTGYLMVAYAPDKDTRARYRKHVENIIDEVLQWSPQMIAGNVTANATISGNITGNSSSFNASGGTGAQQNGSKGDSSASGRKKKAKDAQQNAKQSRTEDGSVHDDL